MSRNTKHNNAALAHCKDMTKWLVGTGLTYAQIGTASGISAHAVRTFIEGGTKGTKLATYAKLKTYYDAKRAGAPMTVTFAGVPFQTTPTLDEAVAKPVSVFTERGDITTLDALVGMLHDESAKHMTTAQDALARFDFDASQRAMCQAKVYRDAHAILVAAQAKTETA